MSSELVRVEREENVLVWTLHRPDSLNALNRPLLQTLRDTVDAARNDHSVRCAIITGAGERAFSAGADLKERVGMSIDETGQFVDLIGSTFSAVAQLPFPTIAAVNGVAFGGGMELLLACDLRVLVDSAQIGLTEVSVGIMPGAGGTQRLPRIVGTTRAKELILSARRLTAHEAYEMGVANRVVARGELMNAARELAGRIAQQAPLAVRQAKHAIDAGLDTSLADGLQIEAAAYAELLHTQDRVEGLTAFAEKRTPQYRGE